MKKEIPLYGKEKPKIRLRGYENVPLDNGKLPPT